MNTAPIVEQIDEKLRFSRRRRQMLISPGDSPTKRSSGRPKGTSSTRRAGPPPNRSRPSAEARARIAAVRSQRCATGFENRGTCESFDEIVRKGIWGEESYITQESRLSSESKETIGQVHD